MRLGAESVWSQAREIANALALVPEEAGAAALPTRPCRVFCKEQRVLYRTIAGSDVVASGRDAMAHWLGIETLIRRGGTTYQARFFSSAFHQRRSPWRNMTYALERSEKPTKPGLRPAFRAP